MTRASELKKSDVIEVNGTLYAIRQIEVQSPSARGAAPGFITNPNGARGACR